MGTFISRRYRGLRSFNAMFTLGLLVAACGGGGGSGSGGGGSAVSVDEVPSPPQTIMLGQRISASAQSSVGPGGGIVQLTNLAAATIPANFLSGTQSVRISATTEPETAMRFDVLAEIYGVSFRQSFEVRINIGASPPQTGPTTLSLTIPDDFLAAVSPGSSIVSFLQQELGGDEEQLVQFVPDSSTFDSTAKTITVQLDSDRFSSASTNDSTYEAVIVLGVVPSIAIQPSAALGINNLAASSNLAISNLAASAIKLGPPLDVLLNPNSPFGPRTSPKIGMHYGTDIKAKFNIVIASESGTLTRRAQRVPPYPNGELSKKGWGYYALIQHSDGTLTLYAHLAGFLVKAGPVTKGQKIGVSGQSGGANPALNTPKNDGRGPHLHFALIRPGFVPPPASGGLGREAAVPFVDPWPKITSTFTDTLLHQDGFTHVETDTLVGDKVTGTHTWTLGSITGGFKWNATITKFDDPTATTRQKLTGFVTDHVVFPGQTFPLTGEIVLRADKSAFIQYQATGPGLGPTGGLTNRPPPY